jgi:hypothetical protein
VRVCVFVLLLPDGHQIRTRRRCLDNHQPTRRRIQCCFWANECNGTELPCCKCRASCRCPTSSRPTRAQHVKPQRAATRATSCCRLQSIADQRTASTLTQSCDHPVAGSVAGQGTPTWLLAELRPKDGNRSEYPIDCSWSSTQPCAWLASMSGQTLDRSLADSTAASGLGGLPPCQRQRPTSTVACRMRILAPVRRPIDASRPALSQTLTHCPGIR